MGKFYPTVTELFLAKSLPNEATQVSTSIRGKRPVMAKENNHLQSLQFRLLKRNFDTKFVKKYISITGWFEAFHPLLKETSGAYGRPCYSRHLMTGPKGFVSPRPVPRGNAFYNEKTTPKNVNRYHKAVMAFHSNDMLMTV